jgi:hypothetical protein
MRIRLRPDGLSLLRRNLFEPIRAPDLQQRHDPAQHVRREMRALAMGLQGILVDVLLVQHEVIGIIRIAVCDERDAAGLRPRGSEVTGQDVSHIITPPRASPVLGDDGWA